MKYLFLFLFTSPAWACRAAPANYHEQLEKKAKEVVKEKGLKLISMRNYNHSMEVKATSGTDCRKFFVGAGIGGTCAMNFKVTEETPCQ